MTGRLLGLEVRTLWGWLTHTRLVWWILVVAVAAPVGAVAVSTLRVGPLPWLVWGPILCMLPTTLVFAYAGYRRAQDARATLRAVWLGSAWAAWVAELGGIAGVAGAAALVLAGGVVAVTAGSFQGWGDAATLAAMLGTDFALLWSFGLWVGSWWPGPGGMVVVVGVPLGSVVANTTLLVKSASPGWILGIGLAAMTPWTVLAGAGSDTWGFGGFTGLFHAVLGLMVAATVLLAGASVRRRLNLPDRGWTLRGPSALATAALLVVTLAAAWQPNSPSPVPPIQVARHAAAVTSERIRLRVAPGGILQATATIRPVSTLAHLWLNPALAVSAVTIGGRPIAFHRTDGYIRVAAGRVTGAGTVVVRYGGRLDEWGWSGNGRDPVTTAFTSGAGAYLPAGGWYPVVPPDTSQVNTPSVARYTVSVQSPWPVVMSNLGQLGRAWVGRTTTGVTLVAGALAPVASRGVTLWGGVTERASLARGYGRMGFIAPYALADRPTPGSLRAKAAGIPVRRLNALDLVFGGVPNGLVALDNPNVIPDPFGTFMSSGAPPAELAISEAFTMNPAVSILFTQQADQMALLWSAISPHWTRFASFDRPWAANQQPADRVLLWTLNRWPGIFGVGGSGVGGPFPTQVNAFTGLTLSQVQAMWRQFAAAAAHGHWPTPQQVTAWRHVARQEASHA